MKARAVRRGDGTVYPSRMAAARAIVAEQGAGDVRYVSKNIAACASGRLRTAYGHEWESVEECDCCPCCGRPLGGANVTED